MTLATEVQMFPIEFTPFDAHGRIFDKGKTFKFANPHANHGLFLQLYIEFTPFPPL